ncbi:hypothetical protein NKR19_g446 [Coniochaeta hoffmannii]|uniref:Carbohydrate-binding module family 19 domain-containing protein n=1 Tax=Coniochaeta hoffmannii TaxID=91930 RepID=A0AA38S0C7_9PEZI|nr:hypothetical protein NKR19_g446 [Coniochaeta hoffmannii]
MLTPSLILVLISPLALTLHHDRRDSTTCTGIAYRCSADSRGWEVCDGTGHWVTGGSCAPSERCAFNTANGSPYCRPDTGPTPTPTPTPVPCGSPDFFACNAAGTGYDRCDATSHKWVPATDCGTGYKCAFPPGSVVPHAWCVVGTTPTPTPTPTPVPCPPGTYRCVVNDPATSYDYFEVCDVDRAWKYGGRCADGEVCEFNSLNGSPYCMP